VLRHALVPVLAVSDGRQPIHRQELTEAERQVRATRAAQLKQVRQARPARELLVQKAGEASAGIRVVGEPSSPPNPYPY
jgi:hypothetical protein